MNDAIMTVLGQLGLLALFAIPGVLLFRRDFNGKWLLAALGLYIVNDICLTGGNDVIPPLSPNLAWNWEGKLIALIATLAIASLPQFGWKRVGLRWHQGENPWLAYLVFGMVSLFFLGLALSQGDGSADLETIIFQWTMPGLEEEVFFRGTLLLALNEAFRKKVSFLGAPIGYGGVLTSLIFGFAHALSFDAGAYSFDFMTFLVTGGPAFILLWLRERTGSVLLPVIGHNVANGLPALL